MTEPKPNSCLESSPVSDAALLGRARSDPAAFRELYNRYVEQIHGFHLHRTKQPEAAMDLTAETFARAWISRDSFRDQRRGSVGPWLFGIARHVLLASVERRRLETSAAERLGLLDRLDGPRASSVPDESWTAEVEQAFEQLPLPQRQAVRLRVLDDMAYHDIARQLECSPLAARIRVCRGLATLRGRLTPYGLEITNDQPQP